MACIHYSLHFTISYYRYFLSAAFSHFSQCFQTPQRGSKIESEWSIQFLPPSLRFTLMTKIHANAQHQYFPANMPLLWKWQSQKPPNRRAAKKCAEKKTQTHLFVKKFCLRFIDILWKFQPLKCDIFIPKIIKKHNNNNSRPSMQKKKKIFCNGIQYREQQHKLNQCQYPNMINESWMNGAKNSHKTTAPTESAQKKNENESKRNALFSLWPFHLYSTLLLLSVFLSLALLLLFFYSFVRSFLGFVFLCVLLTQ